MEFSKKELLIIFEALALRAAVAVCTKPEQAEEIQAIMERFKKLAEEKL